MCGIFVLTSLNDMINVLISDFAQFQIYDPNNRRYEVPIPTPVTTSVPDTMDYGVNVTPNPFGFAVFRKSTGAAL